MLAARGRIFLSCWLAFGIVLAVGPAVARAGDRTIVLLDVEGEETPRLRQSLERIIKTQHEILPASAFRDAARRLRAKKLTPNNIKKVCGYLKVDAVVDGTIEQDAGGYKFIVRLRSAVSGVIEKKFPIRLVQPRLRPEMADKLAARLMPAIDDLPLVEKDGQDATRVAAAGKGKGKGKSAVEREEAAGAEQEELSEVRRKQPARSSKGKEEAVAAARKGKGKAKGADEADEAEDEEAAPRAEPRRKPVKRKQRVAAGDDEPLEEEDTGEGEPDGERLAGGGEFDDEDEDGEVEGSLEGEEDESLTAAASTPRTTPLLLTAGMSFIGRKLSFNYSGADPEDAPPGFSGIPVPGAYVVGEVYPAGFSDGKQRGGLADFGVGFVLDRAIKLNSTHTAGMEEVTLPTRMWRYGVNARFRHNFDEAPNGYSVNASVGFNTAGFVVAKKETEHHIDLPNVQYKYMDAGGGGRIPIADKLSLLAEAKLLAPLTTGQIQTNQHYGPATVFGFEGEAVFEYQFTSNVMARAGGRFMLLDFSFDGDGALDDHDGDGQNDIDGASDRYLGGYVTAGYWF
jgi:hypothetical protein